MSRKIHTIQDVVDWNLCVGCGACVAMCTHNHGTTLEDIGSVGIRPKFTGDYCKHCSDCLSICPGYSIDASEVRDTELETAIENLLVGTYHALYEGHSADPYIRYTGSSGGVLTSLAAYCLEQEGMDFVLHTAMNPDEPWKNRTVISRSREELIARAGSRYCTSSPCEWLDRIENNDKPCVFIGKPCDVAALTKARRVRPELDRKVGLAMSFFCAGTPCSDAVMELANTLGADTQDISSVHFRGQGWPGKFRVNRGPESEPITNTYIDTWKKLSRRRPFRCHICPDGMGQLSDIVSGDAWNRYTGTGENPGLSHVIVRTAHGREILKKAEDAGYLNLLTIEPDDIIEAQGLVLRRTMAFGRIVGMKLTGAPTTEFKNFHLLQAWLKNNPSTMLISIFGTLKRMALRGLYRKGTSYYR
ncbi:Coenzyme F420 hydrogenase/dehydrogenase, beta subunit C-terminal domain [Desulfosediminicola flagellatus]|uniref:Coenzyme F420 hydrogenase/dehydrogenase, beta subunit C-terminal domain n=1 Tax=Desulfosediminicola flagellatus TaxID=2569541 RepID=UPI0010AD4AB3|nr:Coenzyme F420 hydrogenase/dehydrogenase, beta subunit C-terminal domain [Desulfosediminicola flagellatus]